MTESGECDAAPSSTEQDPARFVYPVGVLGSLLLLASGNILLFVAGIALTLAVAKQVAE
ncbi:hypothetical protein [Halostagnicola kamekurae]|uniref:Uncharacterized protein n=1 Tax=Halostagnicola kamekurae TaxID=619731 RepID=A0A1I6Q2R0_9EURY|nr:hypothetical protein [Halostagnicola kamekurae]SFS46625.1 hypothetical protein SAMN04488556_0937 [Halostagnicola kamekurae]